VLGFSEFPSLSTDFLDEWYERITQCLYPELRSPFLLGVIVNILQTRSTQGETSPVTFRPQCRWYQTKSLSHFSSQIFYRFVIISQLVLNDDILSILEPINTIEMLYFEIPCTGLCVLTHLVAKAKAN